MSPFQASNRGQPAGFRQTNASVGIKARRDCPQLGNPFLIYSFPKRIFCISSQSECLSGSVRTSSVFSPNDYRLWFKQLPSLAQTAFVFLPISFLALVRWHRGAECLLAESRFSGLPGTIRFVACGQSDAQLGTDVGRDSVLVDDDIHGLVGCVRLAHVPEALVRTVLTP